jgi:hypothetical protein
MDYINIVKHKNPDPVNNKGDILYPSEEFNVTGTGSGWYSKPGPHLFLNTPYIPLCSIHENPWNALGEFNITTAEFKDKIRYVCPYTEYMFYWCVPVVLFSNDLSFWVKRTTLPEWKTKRFLDFELMKKFQPVADKNGFRFTKIQRALLGTGYTANTRIFEGEAYLYDVILALNNNQDVLGAKVWLWFNKMGIK